MENSRRRALKDQIRALGPIHFVGALGTGMFPLASICHELGAAVTGEDLSTPKAETPFAVAMEGSERAASFLLAAKTLVVSTAVNERHPAVRGAKSSGVPVLHRSELLALISGGFKTIAVAGTHGKSTTSALITHLFRQAGVSVSWIIGAPFADHTPAFGLGISDFLVIEADESDGSFLRYRPLCAVVTNVDPDHLDHYGNFESLVNAFAQFSSLVIEGGALVTWGDSEICARLQPPGVARVTYGESANCDYHVVEWRANQLTTISTVECATGVTEMTLPLTGRHNILNAACAVAVGSFCGVPAMVGARALESFPGVYRRLQRYRCRDKSLLIFDDYAHNPGKILSCLRGLRDAFPDRRILAVFQPHRYSRISSLYAEFLESFKVDNVVVIALPVYAAGEASLPGFTAERLASDISTHSGCETFFVETLKECSDLIKSIVIPISDVLVTLGAGDVSVVADTLSREL